jgi:hypothetical protein
LAAAVRAIASAPEAAAGMARHARDVAQSQYSAALMAERTEAFYRDLRPGASA